MPHNPNIIQFPRARENGPFCEPLSIHFPLLYRIVQTVTPAELVAERLTDLWPLDGHVDYTINPDQTYTGTAKRRAIDRIIDAEFGSLIIRYHRELAAAQNYLLGIADAYGMEVVDPVWGTEAGLFTLVRRPTEKSWPGPLVIYIADWENEEGFQDWEMSTAPDGKTCESTYL